MSRERPRDTTASIRQRLLNQARNRKEDFQLLLTRYAIERLLHRLSNSKHADSFVLKGAFMFLVWTDELYRTTKDLDLLGFGDSSTERIVAVFKELCDIRQNDGLVFVPNSVSAEEIREGHEYEGVRVTMESHLGEARIPLQIDIGFGDVVIPQAEFESFPTILDMPAPRLRRYSRDSVVAEKYEATVRLGIANSRMKDFYDVWIMLREFGFEGATFCSAIQTTFKRRNTPLPETTPLALTSEFSKDTSKQAQWRAFSSRARLRIVADDLESVIGRISSFLFPPTEALVSGRQFKSFWPPGGPWQE